MKRSMMVIVAGVASSVFAADIYVSPTGDGSDGLSWATAFTNIQTAVDASGVNDSIRIAAGNYAAAVPLAVADMTGLTVTGGYGPGGEPGTGETVLTSAGWLPSAMLTVSNCSNLSLSRLTFADNFVSNSAQTVLGGALFIRDTAGVLIDQCCFTNNRALSNPLSTTGYAVYGGSLCLSNVTDALVQDTPFVGNQALYRAATSGHAGKSLYGGAVASLASTATFSRCEFTRNQIDNRVNSISTTSYSIGGGLYATGGGLTVEDCVFDLNRVDNYADCPLNSAVAAGGGAASEGAAMAFRNCVFTRNAAGYSSQISSYVASFGGGFYSSGEGISSFTNCLFAVNSTFAPRAKRWETSLNGHRGSGAAIYGQLRMRLVNCTFVGHLSSAVYQKWTSVSAEKSSMINCLFRNNLSDATSMNYYGFSTILNCNIQNNFPGGASNISADPKFVSGSWHCATNSPNVDAGLGMPGDYGLADRTILADGALDTGTTDIGYHYTSGFAHVPANIYVSTSGNDGNSGTAEAPLRTVTKAVSRLQGGDTLHVASGSYQAGEVFPIQINGLKDVRVVGASSGTTVLDNGGVDGNSVLEIDFCRNLFVSGITVTKGNHRDLKTPASEWAWMHFFTTGGGMNVRDTTVGFEDCRIVSNQVVSLLPNGHTYGGGAFFGGSVVTMTNCVASSNACLSSSVVFGSNPAVHGGGIACSAASLALDRCVISHNQVSGLYTYTWTPNYMNTRGSGIYFGSNTSDPASSTARLRNCLIADNVEQNLNMPLDKAKPQGVSGQLSSIVKTKEGLVLENCTVVNTTTPERELSAGGVSSTVTGGGLVISNSIVWGHTDDLYAAQASDLVIGTSDIEDGDNVGVAGNLSSDPIFYNAGQGNFKIKWTSPCKDTGETDPSWMTAALDLAGNSRVLLGAVDMGCYEVLPPPGTFLSLR